MGDRTRKLVALMIRDKNFAEYMENGWNCLYNDIMTTHYSKWYLFDELAGMAICGYLEEMGVL